MSYSICLLCGLPGAGKTTVANQLCKDRKNAECGFIHINYDLLMPAVNHAKPLNEGQLGAWKSARQCIMKNIEIILSNAIKNKTIETSLLKLDEGVVQIELENILIQLKNKNTDAGSNIVMLIDDNMQYRGMRYEYHRLCAKLEIGLSIVYFDVPLERCIRNNEKRKFSLDKNVIVKLFHQMEIPGSHQKCKWEKYVCILGHEEISNQLLCVNKIREVVLLSILNPATMSVTPVPEEVEKLRQINRKNFIHQADICMRRCVSMKIEQFRLTQPNSKDLSVLSKDLVCAKHSIHALLKIGYVDENEFIGDDGNINTEKLGNKVNELMVS